MKNGKESTGDGKLRRLRYFKGQMLTAQDFKAQQTYHIDRLASFQELFAHGIVGGLNVTYDDVNFNISKGLAFDEKGKQLRVGGEKGLNISKDDVNNEIEAGQQKYLSIVYTEELECAPHSVCETKAKNDRCVETVKVHWGDLPNEEGQITLALIERDPDTEAFKICLVKDKLGRLIRINAHVVDTDSISDGAITAAKLGLKAVNTVHLDDGAVGTAQLADGAVTLDKLKDVSIVIPDGSVTESKLGTGAVTPSKIADNAVDFQHIANDAVRSQHILNDAVGASEIADNAVDFQHIATGAVRSQHILNDAVGASEIADNAVGSQHILNGAVGASEIATGAVRSQHILNDAVGASEIADNAVGSQHILNDAVGASEIADNAVDFQHIATDAVRSQHILNDAVGASEIADNVVDFQHIATDAVRSQHILNGEVGELEIATDAIRSQHILNGEVTRAKLSLEESLNEDLDVPVEITLRVSFIVERQDINKPRFTQVILLTESGEVSWRNRQLQVGNTDRFEYIVEVQNTGAVRVQVRVIVWTFN